MISPAVLLVTDPRWSPERIDEVIRGAAGALPPGAFAVQLRDKALSPSDLARTVDRLRTLTSALGATLVVNATTLEALEVAKDADGAHVPCRPDMLAAARARFASGAWLSTPAHADGDVPIAEDGRATCVLVSPIFASPGKGTPRGVAALREARARSGLLVFALGGVDESNARACADAGAHGVAVIRALLDAADVARTARALHAPFAPQHV